MTCFGAHLGRSAASCLMLRSCSGVLRTGERRLDLPGVGLLRLLSDESLRLGLLPTSKLLGVLARANSVPILVRGWALAMIGVADL